MGEAAGHGGEKITSVTISGTMTMRFLLAIVLIIVWMSAQSHQQLQSGGKGGRNQNPTSNTPNRNAICQPGTEKCPAIVKILPTPKNEAEADEDEKQRKEKAELDRKLVKFSGDLAYYTKVLAWVAILQFLVLVAQAIFLRLAFKESRRSGDIARDAMIAGERAFVFPVGLAQFWEHVQETNLYNWRFRTNWQNSGETPTKNLTIHASGMLRDTPLPVDFNFNYSTQDTGTGLIPPKMTLAGGVVPRIPTPALSPQDILDIQAGTKFFYIWGWARYLDVFPNTPQRVTRFCWILTLVGDPRVFRPESTNIQERLTFGYLYCPQGNCADEECGDV